MEDAGKNTQSIDAKVLARIRSKGKGSVHVPGDFLDLGSREAVDLVLHRLVKKGTLRRLARGVYDFPEQHPVLRIACRHRPIPSRRRWPDAIALACNPREPMRRTLSAYPSKCPPRRCS